MTSKYDIIIAGAGLAGLSLAYKIKRNQQLSALSILLIDPEKKVKNDRTWCFWSREQEIFEDIVFKKWSKIKFASDTIDKDFDILPYEYKMIRGIDFYNHVTEFLSSQDGVDFLFSKIESIKEENNKVTVITQERTILLCMATF